MDDGQNVHERHAVPGALPGEDRWRFALEVAGDGVWDWNARTDTVFFSHQWKAMLGYADNEIGDRLDEWSTRVHPDDLARVMAEVQAHLEGRTDGYLSEHRVRCKDGSYKWVLDRGRVVSRTPDGLPLRVIGTHTDITARKRAEEALRVSEEDYRVVSRLTSDYIFRLSVAADGTATMDLATDNLLTATGRTIEQVRTPIDWQRFVHPEDGPRLSHLLERLKRQGGFGEFEGRFYGESGSLRWVRVVAEATWDERAGRTTSIVGAVSDLSARKLAEEEHQRLQEQLAQAQKIESIGRLAGGVAHDFNNMLGVILGHAELALEQLEPDHQIRGDLVEIQKAASRSAELTRQLLAFARRQTVVPCVLDLNVAIDGSIRMLRRLIGEDVSLEWTPARGLWTVRIDPSQVSQVLTNLCVNARDAIDGVGTVGIETVNCVVSAAKSAAYPGTVPGDYVRLSVRDTGCGMTPDVLAHLFEPFFTTKRQDEGTGLGLATVYGIVTQNRGFVEVTSAAGAGTTIRVYLPRHAGAAEPDEEAADAAPAGAGHETILVVEDEPAILQIARRMLERLGYRVVAASAPGEALRLAAEHTGAIHLLLADVVMPEMNGRDLAMQLRQRDPRIKLVFMSGYAADAVVSEPATADAFVLQKPFTAAALAAKIREALDCPAH